MKNEALFVGIDAGLTDTKVAVIDHAGRTIASSSRHLEPSHPHTGWQERNLDDVFMAAAEAVAECVGFTAVDRRAIVGVGLCAHADGLYAIDVDGRPVRPAILATDSRARSYSVRYRSGPDAQAALAVTGQVPFPGSPAALIPWLRDHERSAYDATRWFVSCKDWLRFRLTGAIGTDITDASAAFVDVHQQEYSRRACELFGVPDVFERLPPTTPSEAVVGTITAAAANLTGLAAGTPVVAGAHDVDAAALGMGATQPGAYSMIAGTFAINQVVAERPHTDARWQARSFLMPDRWLHMATSPNSASNLAWIVRLLGPSTASGQPDVAAAVTEGLAATRTDYPTFRPNLYGSAGDGLGGAFSGLSGDHVRADLIRAVLEGIVFHHRSAVDALATTVAASGPIRLAGGLARSRGMRQLFADGMGRQVCVSGAPEVGALGACILAAVGVGRYPSLSAGVQAMAAPWFDGENGGERVEPRAWPARDERFAQYRQLVAGSDNWGSDEEGI